MEILKWLQLIIGAGFLLCGMAIFAIQIFGVFRFSYVLNRMHAAALGDTLGLAVSLLGLMILCGFSFITLKLALVVVFLWIASPVSSHLVARLEVTTNESEKHFEREVR